MDNLSRRDAVKFAAGVAALGVSTAAAGAGQVKQPDPDGDPAHARGSAKLLARLEAAKKANKLVVNFDELRMLAERLERSNITVNWWTHGIPAIDLIVARGETSPKDVGNLMKTIYEANDFKQIRCYGDVFPLGIPVVLGYLVGLRIQNRPTE
jgi:hypothetical protein